ncbi:MAG: DUF4157 domain-containing protein [Deltaproteobacteria bacterium]|nr:DUF4157 domain-containing protein [Deltaproteobacteria bacterium]
MRHQETTSQGKVRQTTRPVTQSDSAREDARAQGAESARGPVLGSLSGAHDRLGNGSIGELSAQVRPESPRELYVSQLLALETAVSTDMSAYLPWNASLDWMLFVDRWYGLLFESQADSAVESVGPATAEPALARKPMGGADPRSPDGLGEWIESLRAMGGSGRPLSAQERGFLAEVHGRAMPNIMIHEGAVARAAAAAVNARAFTVETDIYLGEAASLESAEGASMLAHESTHALQHIAGRDRSIAGQISRPGQPLEVEAEARGRDALRIWETRGEAWAFEPPAATDSRGQLIAELMRAQLPAPGPAPAGKVEAQVEGVLVAEARAKLDNLRFSVELDEQLSEDERAELLTELDRLHVGVATDLRLSARVAELSAPQLLAQLERVLPPYVGLAEQVEGLTNAAGDQAVGDALGGLSEPSGARLQTMIRSLSSALGLGPIDVHLGEEGAARARAAGTRGLMEGGEVFLDAARFDANSADARGLIAHELTHAAQLQLDPLTGPDAGLYAEAEAHVAAEAFARGGALPELQAGIPQGHVAAEGDLGANLSGLIAALNERMTAAAVTPDVGPAPENTIDPNATEDGDEKLEQYTGGVDGIADLIGDLEAFDELCEACDDEEDTGPSLSKVKGSEHYKDLCRMWQGAKEGGDQSGAMMSAFENEFNGRGFWGSTEQAFDLVRRGAKADARPEPQAADAKSQANLADQNAVAATNAVEGDTGNTALGVAPALPEANAAIDPLVAAQLNATVPETLPAIASFDSIKPDTGISDERLDAVMAQLSHQQSFATNAPNIGTSRTPQILETLGENFGGSFLSSFVDQGLDTALWDNVGFFGDQVLKRATGGKMGTPFIGPIIGLIQNNPFSADAYGLGDERIKGVTEGWSRMGSTLDLAGAATGTDKVGLYCAAIADFFGVLRDVLDSLATLCGTLSALCYVVGGLLILFGLALVWFAGVGAPLITAGGWICRAGNLLGRVNNVLSMIVLVLTGITTGFRTAAAFMVPSDQYAEQLKLLGADAGTFGEKAGGKAGDMTATNASNATKQKMEDKTNAAIASQTPDGQAGADQAERIRQLQEQDAQALQAEIDAERQRQAQNGQNPQNDPNNPANQPNGQPPQNDPNQNPQGPRPLDDNPLNRPSSPGRIRAFLSKVAVVKRALDEMERMGRQQHTADTWRQLEAKLHEKAQTITADLTRLNSELTSINSDPNPDPAKVREVTGQIRDLQAKAASTRRSLDEAQRAIPLAEDRARAVTDEESASASDPTQTVRQQRLEETRRKVAELETRRQSLQDDTTAAQRKLDNARTAETEAAQKAADAERAHDDHIGSENYRTQEAHHRQQHADRQRERTADIDRMTTEIAEKERLATKAEEAAPLRETARQQDTLAKEATQRAERALTDMKSFENQRIKLDSDDGGADGLVHHRLISVNGDTVTVTNGQGKTQTLPISAIRYPKALRDLATRVKTERSEAERLRQDVEQSTQRADALAPPGTNPTALRQEAQALRSETTRLQSEQQADATPGTMPDAQRDQLAAARDTQAGEKTAASGQVTAAQQELARLSGEQSQLDRELGAERQSLQRQQDNAAEIGALSKNDGLNKGSSGNATGGVGSAYKGVAEWLQDTLFGWIERLVTQADAADAKVAPATTGAAAPEEKKHTAGTYTERAVNGLVNLAGVDRAMTDQRETPAQLQAFGEQQAERERHRNTVVNALLSATPPVADIEAMNQKRVLATEAFGRYKAAYDDAKRAEAAEKLVDALSAQTLQMAQEGKPLKDASVGMTEPLNTSAQEETQRKTALAGLGAQNVNQPEGGVSGIVTELITKLATHADRMDKQPVGPTGDTGTALTEGPTLAKSEKERRTEESTTASDEQRAFLDQAIAARAAQEQSVTESIMTLEQKHAEEQGILNEIKLRKAESLVKMEQERALVDQHSTGFHAEFMSMETWSQDYATKRAAVEAIQ